MKGSRTGGQGSRVVVVDTSWNPACDPPTLFGFTPETRRVERPDGDKSKPNKRLSPIVASEREEMSADRARNSYTHPDRCPRSTNEAVPATPACAAASPKLRCSKCIAKGSTSAFVVRQKLNQSAPWYGD